MSIQEHLNKIRNAIYGREVRESIAKGIETAYDDASENGNANMEVKIARGTHPNLRSRLEKVDNKQQQTTAQLAEKANRNEVRFKDIPVGLNDVGVDLLNAISASEGAEFSIYSIPRNHSVSPIKTTFIETSNNLFNMNNLIKGLLVDGEYQPAETWYYTPHLIPITPNTDYTLSFVNERISLTVYDVDGNFIKEQTFDDGDHTLTGGANFGFLGLSVHQYVEFETIMLNEGSVALPYEEYYEKLADNILLPGMVSENERLDD